MSDVKTTIFDPVSNEEEALIIAKHLPRGHVWTSAFNPAKNFGKLIAGMALEFRRFAVLVKSLFNEMDINQTSALLPEWEASVSIPDNCFRTNVNEATRRLQVLSKFSKYNGAQTGDDFERIALVFGYVVTVAAGPADHTFTVTVVSSPPGVTFPLPFPIPFSSGGGTFLECLFNSLAPANVQVIIA
jgi:uncharacterized protein YmfQ (DUF2313 family)